jgi:hypothetical protein
VWTANGKSKEVTVILDAAEQRKGRSKGIYTVEMIDVGLKTKVASVLQYVSRTSAWKHQ